MYLSRRPTGLCSGIPRTAVEGFLAFVGGGTISLADRTPKCRPHLKAVRTTAASNTAMWDFIVV